MLIASHIHIMCKQRVLVTCYDAVDGHMGPPLHCYAYVGWCGNMSYRDGVVALLRKIKREIE